MNLTYSVLSAAACIAMCSNSAIAGTVKVTVLPSGVTTDYNDGSPITIDVDNFTTAVRLWHADLAAGDIPSVFINNTSTDVISVSLSLDGWRGYAQQGHDES